MASYLRSKPLSSGDINNVQLSHDVEGFFGLFTTNPAIKMVEVIKLTYSDISLAPSALSALLRAAK